MNVDQYYQNLLKQRAEILGECIKDSNSFAMHVASHNFLKDFDLVMRIISGREKIIFSQACREFQYSLEAVLYGNYRHAFSSLRLAFELFTASIYFSAHQMKMNLWLEGGNDLYWSQLNDENNGVYSQDFIRAFYPEMGIYRRQYFNMAGEVYRECSEYVHGNPGTHEDPSQIVAYDAAKLQSFHDRVATVRLCVLFQFVVRYLRELGPEEKNRIEPLVMEAFGDLPEIQANFGAVGQ